ncbi:high-affinity Zn(2+) transporter zrt1 [Entomortierella beljakovae]|nr:high-affinity Zn(2+) transporter zrt1 [Entomortierella beljakovae]
MKPRSSFKPTFVALVALFIISNVSVASTASSPSLVRSFEHPEASFNKALNNQQIINKRAGEDDGHDHDHPTTSLTSAAITATSNTATAATPTSTAPADHEDDHDHGAVEDGHDHGAVEDGHDHGAEDGAADEHLEESSHDHGPARTCDPHNHSEGEYVLWHHIVALVILMIVAGFGCLLPMFVPDGPRARFFVQVGKYFGAGVVLSVAFIHIMPEALFSLTHPCLSTAWTEDYPGYAPLIMMVSGLCMLVIEFLASSLVMSVSAYSKGESPATTEALEHGHSHSHRRGSDDKKQSIDLESSSPSPTIGKSRANEKNDDCNHAHGLTLLQCGPGVSARVSTYMLELGIALHSVFIGISLGVLAGNEFLAMTIAICFHQFFEGIALGSRIAEIHFERRWLPIALVAAFALVTPLGIAIGMGIQSTYKSNSVENLIVMGIFDSVACGVLLYTAFVTLLGGDILYSEKFRSETRSHKACCLLAVWVGAAAMAALAIWA